MFISKVAATGVCLMWAVPAAAQGWHEMMPWGWMGHGMWMFWILVIGFVIFFVARRADTPERKSEAPVEILRRRLARGEITEEEFERLKKKMES